MSVSAPPHALRCGTSCSVVGAHSQSRHVAGTDCCLAARGGTRQCQEGEGDCGRDSDCEGTLVCGDNNCVSQFGKNGQLWDEGDDCCRQRCDPDHPCHHGEVWKMILILSLQHVLCQGACQQDTDCERPGYNICQPNCLDQAWFPAAQFPNNTADSSGWTVADSCCRRACMPASPCGNGVEGCLEDEDCLPGTHGRTFVKCSFPTRGTSLSKSFSNVYSQHFNQIFWVKTNNPIVIMDFEHV